MAVQTLSQLIGSVRQRREEERLQEIEQIKPYYEETIRQGQKRLAKKKEYETYKGQITPIYGETGIRTFEELQTEGVEPRQYFEGLKQQKDLDVKVASLPEKERAIYNEQIGLGKSPAMAFAELESKRKALVPEPKLVAFTDPTTGTQYSARWDAEKGQYVKYGTGEIIPSTYVRGTAKEKELSETLKLKTDILSEVGIPIPQDKTGINRAKLNRISKDVEKYQEIKTAVDESDFSGEQPLYKKEEITFKNKQDLYPIIGKEETKKIWKAIKNQGSVDIYSKLENGKYVPISNEDVIDEDLDTKYSNYEKQKAEYDKLSEKIDKYRGTPIEEEKIEVPTVTSRDDVAKITTGQQFSLGGKIYEKVSETEFKPIGE